MALEHRIRHFHTAQVALLSIAVRAPDHRDRADRSIVITQIGPS